MTLKTLSRSLLLMGICAAAATADGMDVTYTLNFTGGSVTPTGGFTFDPDSGKFTAFSVSVGTDTFNFLNIVNGSLPSTATGPCLTADDAAGIFNALTSSTCSQAGEGLWAFTPTGASFLPDEFELGLCSLDEGCTDLPLTADSQTPASGSEEASFGHVTSTLVPAAVPEPSTYGLMLVGLGALVWHRKRLVPENHQATPSNR